MREIFFLEYELLVKVSSGEELKMTFGLFYSVNLGLSTLFPKNNRFRVS